MFVCYCSPRIDREVSVEVTSTEPLEYFTYQILGRGDIIVTRTEPVWLIGMITEETQTNRSIPGT